MEEHASEVHDVGHREAVGVGIEVRTKRDRAAGRDDGTCGRQRGQAENVSGGGQQHRHHACQGQCLEREEERTQG